MKSLNLTDLTRRDVALLINALDAALRQTDNARWYEDELNRLRKRLQQEYERTV